MKPVFPTYIIKRRAKAAMHGRLFKAFCIAVLPMLIVTALTALIVMLVPDARETFELAISGQFESREARELYFNDVLNICTSCVNMLSAVFAFLSVGAQRLLLDMLRGKEVKIRDVFRYFDKWYVAIIYPALTVGVTTAARKLLDLLIASGMNTGAVTTLAWVVQLGIYFVACKLMFVEFILADNNCTGVIHAVKTSWGMVGWNTAVNFIALAVSFIGWVVAAAFTAGLALVYFLPYMSLAIAALYDENVKYVTQH